MKGKTQHNIFRWKKKYTKKKQTDTSDDKTWID